MFLKYSTSGEIAEGGSVFMEGGEEIGAGVRNVELTGAGAEYHDHIPNL